MRVVRAFLVPTWVRPPGKQRERLRSEGPSHLPLADTASLLAMTLDDVKHVFARWGSSNRFDFVQTIGTDGVETNAVLGLLDMPGELGLEHDHFFSGEETLEKRILRPCPETREDFVDFCSPAIIRNIICYHITGRLT